MLLVVRPGLLVVENRTLRDPFAIAFSVQFFRLGGDRCQRDALLVLTQRLNALPYQVNGPLAKPGIDLLL